MERRAGILGPCLGQLRVCLQQRFDLLGITGADGVEHVRARGRSAAHRRHLRDRHANE